MPDELRERIRTVVHDDCLLGYHVADRVADALAPLLAAREAAVWEEAARLVEGYGYAGRAIARDLRAHALGVGRVG